MAEPKEQKVKNVATWGREAAKSRYGRLPSLPMVPVKDESEPQFRDEKRADTYNPDANGWVRGVGKDSPYPTFDHGHFDKRKPK